MRLRFDLELTEEQWKKLQEITAMRNSRYRKENRISEAAVLGGIMQRILDIMVERRHNLIYEINTMYKSPEQYFWEGKR